MTRSTSPLRRWVHRTLAVALLCLAGWAWVPVATAAALPAKPPPAVSVEDADRQAALVADEDRRLIQVRAAAAIALHAATPTLNWKSPYRLDTGSGYTLVLTQQSADYTIADLLKLAPQTFVRQPDGAYLLTENIYLNPGAKLVLANPGGLTLRMASNANGFVSIVSFAGRLTLEGTPQAPLTITSWDLRTNRPDVEVKDGRAYVRAIGGQFSMSYTKLSNLGFWSGRTGGLSLTGTDRPDTGAVDGPTTVPKTDQRQQAKPPTEGPAKSGQVPGNGVVVAQPSGALVTPDNRFTVPGQSYVSGKINQSVITGNAFGLFIGSANGITITDTVVEDSLVDGVVLHRFATSVVVEKTTSRRSRRDGFVLSRATEQVRITGSTAESNAGNGFTLSGQPLADGPSASGESIGDYGSNSVSNSVARNNGHYGIEILGGLDVGVQNNEIIGSDMGIVVRRAANKVVVTGNTLRGQARQGIAIRDGVTAATITGNVVEGTQTGIYVRDSVAEVRGNTIQNVNSHGITLVGAVSRSTVTYNVIAGVGPTALDSSRSKGRLVTRENQTYAWHDTRSFWMKFRHYASPMTLLWTGILLLIVFAALKGKHRSVDGESRRLGLHPYADKMPLDSMPPTDITRTQEIPLVRARARVSVMAK